MFDLIDLTQLPAHYTVDGPSFWDQIATFADTNKDSKIDPIAKDGYIATEQERVRTTLQLLDLNSDDTVDQFEVLSALETLPSELRRLANSGVSPGVAADHRALAARADALHRTIATDLETRQIEHADDALLLSNLPDAYLQWGSAQNTFWCKVAVYADPNQDGVIQTDEHAQFRQNISLLDGDMDGVLTKAEALETLEIVQDEYEASARAAYVNYDRTGNPAALDDHSRALNMKMRGDQLAVDLGR